MQTHESKIEQAAVRVLTIRDVINKEVSSEQGNSSTSFAITIRTLLQNWRQGTVACKGRSDVARTNKKPWKQKGTGRARAGSARSPLWRGGGVVFGPQSRTRTLFVTKKMKQKALRSILFNFLNEGKVISVDWQFDSDRPKTSIAFNLLKQLGLTMEKVTLFLNSSDILTYASFSNLANVQILYFDQPNAYDLANSDKWLFLNKDITEFKEMTSKWI